MDGFKPHLPVPPWAVLLTHLEFWHGRDSADEDATPILSAVTEQCISLVHLYLDITWIVPTGHRFQIPSLNTLRISISYGEDEDYLLGIMDLFNSERQAMRKIWGSSARQESDCRVTRVCSMKDLLKRSFRDDWEPPLHTIDV
ncbi:hypothetical protein K438DRAFT_2009094 [Mycena galopus ATCC 62051]|nr:hypothetical protein K438DRAFT_2009094 [Mycena galopus ATCC 62051]